MKQKQEREHILSMACWCKPRLLGYGAEVKIDEAVKIVLAEQIVDVHEDGYDAGWRVHVEPDERG